MTTEDDTRNWIPEWGEPRIIAEAWRLADPRLCYATTGHIAVRVWVANKEHTIITPLCAADLRRKPDSTRERLRLEFEEWVSTYFFVQDHDEVWEAIADATNPIISEMWSTPRRPSSETVMVPSPLHIEDDDLTLYDPQYTSKILNSILGG